MLPAHPGDLGWIPDRGERGTIGDEIVPRWYQVETPSSTFRRNGRDVIHLPAEDIFPRRPESHESDSEIIYEDQSLSGGGLPSPPIHYH